MKSGHAVAILTVPFALTCLLLLAVACLMPYSGCKLDLSAPFSEVWMSALFVVALLSADACLVLSIDMLFVRHLPSIRYRSVLLAIVGAATATLSRVLWNWPLGPRIEFLPFTLSGAIFILMLDRLAGGKNRET